MSHNKTTVNAQEANRAGAITEALGDLSDVTITTVSSGQALVYSGSGWINDTNPNTLGSVFIGEGASQAYSGSGASGVSNGHTVEFYAAPPHNGLSATITSSSNWVSAVALGVGSYRITANVALTFSSSGSVQYQVYQDSTAVGGVGSCAQDDIDCHNPAIALVEVASGTDTFTVKLVTAGSNINSKSNQGNRQAELGYFIIERVE